MFAVASGAAAAGLAGRWTEAWFRTYYLFGAILNVPVLALGTVYSLSRRAAGHVTAVLVIVASAFAVWTVARADLALPALEVNEIPSGAEVVSPSIRLLSRVYSYAGFVVVAAGAAWSARKLARERVPGLRQIALANGLIALGTVVVAVGSAFARVGRGLYFSLGLAAGVTIMFIGFLLTQKRRSERDVASSRLLEEGWYLMNVTELERELGRWRGNDAPRSSAVRLSVEQALAYRDRGNVPDEQDRTLRLVLHVGNRAELSYLQSKRLLYEPDFHDAPTWRLEGSKPINVVPLRVGEIEPGDASPWWEQPELASLEDEWRSAGTVAGLPVPAPYRGFVFKTVLALRAAGKDVTPDAVADSVARWLAQEEAERIRAALTQRPRERN